MSLVFGLVLSLVLLAGSSEARALFPALTPMAQELVGENDGHHGFADGDGADADAGVMAALGDNLGFVAVAVNGFARAQNGGRGFDGKAANDLLAAGNAAENAARVVRKKLRLTAAPDAHLVGVFFARQCGGTHASANLDALDGIDGHHGGGEFGIEFAIDRRAPAGWNAVGDDFDDGAGGRARFADGVEVGSPLLGRLGIVARRTGYCQLRPNPIVCARFCAGRFE